MLDGAAGSLPLTFFSSCCLICFFIWIFSLWRFCWYSLARRPRRFCDLSEAWWTSRAAFLRVRSS